MRTLTSFLFFLLVSPLAYAQGISIELLTVKPAGSDGDMKYFEITYKLKSGKVDDSGQPIAMAIPLPDKTKAFAYLISYESVSAGKNSFSPAQLNVFNYNPKPGQMVVTHELAPVAIPEKRSLQCKTGYAYLLDSDDKLMTATLDNIKGYAKIGDAIQYVNDRGQKGAGTIKDIEIRGGYHSEYIFEGIANQAVTIKVLTNGIDLSNATIGTNLPATEVTANKANNPAPKHKIQSIPIEKVLENNEIKITVHNLIKFNPDPGDSNFDVFKVDYTLDYYIVDATIENKTAQPLDAGDYLLRLNFFTPDGKSADEFLRIFRNGENSNDPVKQDANKVDVNLLGGTSKLPMAQVMVKYIATLPDYDTKYKPQTDAINKPIPARQKIRSVDTTIMGVPPSYKIEGLGTWSGVVLDKKKWLFVPIRM
ncbi:MAG TPA: hypothetical protein VK168_02830 [Saprospiraceae bacterium]|nr:hypothetical protein [Saprospiraceae bacterium]